MTSGDLLRDFRGQLTSAGFESARHEAALLISSRTGYSISLLYSHPELPLTDSQITQLRSDLARRLKHEPIAYLTGSTEFFGLPFIVGPGVLIPRPDSERLVETARDQWLERWRLGSETKRPIRLLDTCTGSGCIGLSLALEWAKRGFAVDLTLVEADFVAASYAQQNMKALLDGQTAQSGAASVRARLVLADLWPAEALKITDELFDVITANPPYIADSVIPGLMPDVVNFEPHAALAGGEDGLDFYRRIFREAPLFLKENGLVFVEHGFDQAVQIEALLQHDRYTDIIQVEDYGGHPRVSGGRFQSHP